MAASVDLCYEIYILYVVLMGRLDGGQSGMLQGWDLTAPVNVKYRASCETSSWRNICKGNSIPLLLKQVVFGYNSISNIFFDSWALVAASLSGEPDYFGRNKILSGYDLSHYQVPHCIRVFFYFVWFVFIHHNFQFYFKLCTYCNILDIYLT